MIECMEPRKTNRKFWMKRRRYGWGWIPVTWQGWAVVVLQGGIVISAALFLPTKPAQPTSAQLTKFWIIVGFAIITLIIISVGTGPTPHWRWGKKDTDDPDEDF